MGGAALWFRQHLGLVASDVLALPSEYRGRLDAAADDDDAAVDAGATGAAGPSPAEPVVAFLRLDRGEEPADHHSIVLDRSAEAGAGAGAAFGYAGAAFEVDAMDDVAAGQLSLRDFAATVPGLALRPGAGPLGGLGRRTFGSAFAHSAALHAAAEGEGEGGGESENESEGGVARALLGFGELSHFTDMDVHGRTQDAPPGCHVFNASGMLQWGGGSWAWGRGGSGGGQDGAEAAGSDGGDGKLVGGTDSLRSAAVREALQN